MTAQKQDTTEKKPTAEAATEKAPADAKDAPSEKKTGPADSRPAPRGRGKGKRFGHGKGGPRKGKKGSRDRRGDDDEFESKIVDLARVTRVMAGGKRMRFRACVVIGDKKGKVGYGLKKGTDVQLAVQKATDQAKKNMINLKLVEGTIPHRVECKFKGAKVLLKPAKAGTGVIAGGPVRMILEIAGIKNIVAKMQGSANKVNNVKAVIEALRELQTKQDIQKITSTEE